MKTTRREIIQMLGVAAGTTVIGPLMPRGTSVTKERVRGGAVYARSFLRNHREIG